MDKPTLPPLRELYADDANGVSVLGISDNDIAAYGDAMAAWGAAQERERIQQSLMDMHEMASQNHDFYLVACVMLFGDGIVGQHTKEIDHDT